MKSFSEKIHQVFTAALTASVFGGITMVMETHTRLALIENNVASLEEKLQESNSMSSRTLER